MQCHSVHPPPLSGEGGDGGWGGVEPLTKFSKKGWGGLTGSQFLEGVAEKEGVTFFPGGLQFLPKNKLKSEMFNDKKSL